MAQAKTKAKKARKKLKRTRGWRRLKRVGAVPFRCANEKCRVLLRRGDLTYYVPPPPPYDRLGHPGHRFCEECGEVLYRRYDKPQAARSA